MGFDEPIYVAQMPEDERAKRVFLTTDFCVVDDTSFFVRGVLVLPVIGIEESFGWGVWSSLSQANFTRYQQHYGDDVSDWQPMFGWLSNRLPDYPDTVNLAVSMQTSTRGQRPLLTLKPGDHPLARDQAAGISLERVLAIVGPFIHP